jgi:suppressor of fused-like protein
MSTMQGWEAIQAKLTTVYGAQQPKHWGTIMRYSEGGPDPLDGISAYKAEDPPHWHYVTFGFSELYDKTSRDREVSGWGFELSFRLKRHQGEKSPPEWPLPFLQKLARYVFNTRTPFDHEHYILWGGPITKEEETKLEALVFATDPLLGEISTPNGRVKFLAAIAITPDEHAFAEAQGPEAFLARLLPGNRLGVVDLKRGSTSGAEPDTAPDRGDDYK